MLIAVLSGRRRQWVTMGVATAVITVATIWFASDHWNSLYDDAFIYLRYARNLRNGCGIAFNCAGPPVEGFTSPLYLALLWLGSLFTQQLIWLSQSIGCGSLIVAGALAVAACVTMGREQGPWRILLLALSCAIAIASDPYVLLNANTGMETATAAACCTFVGLAVMLERPALILTASVAAFLARPEGVLFIAALPLLPHMRRARYLLAAVGAVAVVTLARVLLFDSLLPNTYYAKSGGTWRHAELGAAYILDCVRYFPLTFLAPLALLGARRREASYLLAVACVWALFFLRTGGDTFEYSRLWVPLVPILSALAIAGVGSVVRSHVRFASVLPLLVCVVIGVRARAIHSIPPQGTSARVVEWAAVGTYLRAHVPRGTVVATVPIGAIGYYSSLPILDLVGLTDSTIARSGRSVPAELLDKRWLGHERHDVPYVLSRAPGMIVTTMQRDYAWTLAEAKAGFWADWLLLQEIKARRAPYHVLDAEVMRGTHVLMFERDAPKTK
jgi:arabinofuranosyltransferase